MKVRFDATFDEQVDVNMRVWRASAVSRALRRRDIAIFFVAIGVGAFAAPLMAGAPLPGAAVTAAVAVAMMAPFYGRLYDRGVRRRISRVVREEVGPGDSWPVEIELANEELRMGSAQGSLSVPWTNVRSIHDLSGDVEILFGEAGMLVVRARAFASPGERAAFLIRARELAPKH